MKNHEALFADAKNFIDNADHAAGLKLLLKQYRLLPSPQVADAIEALGTVVASVSGPPESELVLKNIAVKRRFAELSNVLDFVVAGTTNQAHERFLLIEDWEPGDPRFDRALTGWLVALPYQSLTSRKFWGRVFLRLEKATDASILPNIKNLNRVYASGMGVNMRRWLVTKSDALYEKLASKFTTIAPYSFSATEIGLVESIATAIPSKPVSAGDNILQSVFEDPNDDAAKLVYADYLSEMQNPHGEFIQLQFQRLKQDLDRKEVRREKELLNKHWRDFVGPIHKVLLRESLEFEKGFLVSCSTKDNIGPKIKNVLGEPMWAMVKHLQGPFELITHPNLRSLVSVGICRSWSGSGFVDDLIPLCKEKRKFQFEALSCELSGADREEPMAALAKTKAFPKLKSLEFYSYNPCFEDAKGIILSPLGRKLIRFGCRFSSHDFTFDTFAGWHQWLIEHPKALKEFLLEIDPTSTVEVQRDKQGQPSIFRIVFPYQRRSSLLDMLQELDAETVSSLQFDLVHPVSKEDKAKPVPQDPFKSIKTAIKRFAKLNHVNYNDLR